jgi:hypothetical protein
MKYAKVGFCAFGLALACLVAHAAGDAPAVQVALKIDPQPVRVALKEFSSQSGLQVLLRVDNISVDGVLAGKVDGRLTAQAALSQLLRNTGLTYEFVNDRTVRISAGEPANSNAAGGEGENLLALTARQPEHVTISAARQIDKHTLDHIVIPTFVQSHGIASARIDQIGRWESGICPETQGLQPSYNEFVSQRLRALARQVGAPARRIDRCKTNVEILFTPSPAEQVSYVVRTEPVLLGYSPSGISSLTIFDHPIKAWYATRTRSYAVMGASALGSAGTPILGSQGSIAGSAAGTPGPALPMGQSPLDSTFDSVVGGSGGRLQTGLRSEFANVLILIDSNQVSQYSLGAIADYIAMLALTRASLGGCNELPSIIDLLSPDCGARRPPQSITAADNAYLKALYSSNPEMKVSLERDEIHDRMLREILGR